MARRQILLTFDQLSPSLTARKGGNDDDQLCTMGFLADPWITQSLGLRVASSTYRPLNLSLQLH